MKYYYVYKDSSGKRLEKSINASSREEVFSNLRLQGIKAIKVIAADGSKANGDVKKRKINNNIFIIFLPIIFVSLLSLFHYLNSESKSDRNYSGSDVIVLKDMTTNAGLLKKNLNNKIGFIFPRGINDFSVFTNNVNFAIETNKVINSLAYITTARKRLKSIYRSIPDLMQLNSDAGRDAQIAYGQFVDELNAKEILLFNRFKAILLLSENVNCWTNRNGIIIFSSNQIEKKFREYTHLTNIDRKIFQWQRDFNIDAH